MNSWILIGCTIFSILMTIGVVIYNAGGRGGKDEAQSVKLAVIEKDASLARDKADKLENKHTASDQEIKAIWRWVIYIQQRIDRNGIGIGVNNKDLE